MSINRRESVNGHLYRDAPKRGGVDANEGKEVGRKRGGPKKSMKFRLIVFLIVSGFTDEQNEQP
jgi:hypothetical protein